LTYRDWVCTHEQVRFLRGLDDVKSWGKLPRVGSAETTAGPWWRLVLDEFPGIKLVIIRRKPEAVLDSVMKTVSGIDETELAKHLRYLDRKLDQITVRNPDALVVDFDDLVWEAACATIFEHCLPYEHDGNWWRTLSQINVQIDLAGMLRYMVTNKEQLDRLTGLAKWSSIQRMGFGRAGPKELDGVTIQEEPLDAMMADAAVMFADHALEVGEAPGAYLTKNLELMRKLDGLGLVQMTTARANGRLFGYVFALLSPSLESPDRLVGTHTLFYADKAFKGLGLRLQRASVEGLRQKGVDEIFFRAGVRGSGPRLGTIYRRLGAEPFGEAFRLPLAS